MNKSIRVQLRGIIEKIAQCISELETIVEDEMDKVEQYPENLQCTEAYNNLQRGVDTLGDSIEQLNLAIESIEENL